MKKSTDDYILIGAGSAGCVLANRLSAYGKTSFGLLGAGSVDWNLWIHVSVGYFKHAENQSRGSDNYYGTDGPLHVSDMSFT